MMFSGGQLFTTKGVISLPPTIPSDAAKNASIPERQLQAVTMSGKAYEV
jgi:hypothetical protein